MTNLWKMYRHARASKGAAENVPQSVGTPDLPLEPVGSTLWIAPSACTSVLCATDCLRCQAEEE